MVPVDAVRLPQAAVPALITVDDRGHYRLTASRTTFRVSYRHKTVVIDFQVANRGEDSHDATIRDSKGHVVASTGSLAPGADHLGRLRVRLSPGAYIVYCSILAGKVGSHEQLGMRDRLTVRPPRRR